jgi:hypothetical protein
MSEPKEESGRVPPADEKEQSRNEVTPVTTATEGVAAAGKPKDEANNSQTNSFAGKSVRQFRVFVWGCWLKTRGYLGDMFLHEKSAFWTMLFTAVLTVFTIFLWKVADRTDKTVRNQQRPWVEGHEDPLVCLNSVAEQEKRLNLFLNDAPNTGIGGACPFRGPIFIHAKPADKFVWWVHVANTGETPAVRTTLNAARCVSKMPDDTPPSLPDCFNESKDGASVPPRTVYPHDGEVTNEQKFSLTGEELSEINRGASFLYILARTDYSELDGTPHFKNFCWRYNPYQIYSLRYCEGGNDDDTGKGQ